MQYFLNTTTNDYWETMVPVENVEAYLAERTPEGEASIAVDKRPCDCHDYDGDGWVENSVRMAVRNAAVIRSDRNYRLQTEVDPIASNNLRWNELTPEKQTEWANYRTALLNVPQQNTFPADVAWPERP